MAEPTPEQPPRQVDPNRVLQKIQLLDPRVVQTAMLQVVTEDQEEEIRLLRAELVAATAGPTPPDVAPPPRRGGSGQRAT